MPPTRKASYIWHRVFTGWTVLGLPLIYGADGASAQPPPPQAEVPATVMAGLGAAAGPSPATRNLAVSLSPYPSVEDKGQAEVSVKPSPPGLALGTASPAPRLSPGPRAGVDAALVPAPPSPRPRAVPSAPEVTDQEPTTSVSRLSSLTAGSPSLASADLQFSPDPSNPDQSSPDQSSPDQSSPTESSPTESLTDPDPPAEQASPITETRLSVQGLYVLQGGRSSGRARLAGTTFVTPNLLLEGALDWVAGPDLTNRDGVKIPELYLAAAVPGTPGLRFRLGQLDLTSYFDRNSFAKDLGRDFFNPTFHTNPALIAGANATASRLGGLVQWSVNDDLMVSASTFSSSGSLSAFALDGLVGEVTVRADNLILRGTALTGRDLNFQGTGDRLSSYGLNAEWFVPQVNLGVFGRYGHLTSSSGFLGDAYSIGLNAFDVFMAEDRLGLAYGRNLPTASVNGRTPDVLEVFYDFVALPQTRLGFTFQQRNAFQDSFLGFRIRSTVNLLPPRSRP
ncbi:MAG: hypothetical protein VKI82_03140 [Leptolyngbya sp.]|nr:hypothetical protein [Leptolyngbya sp.]